MTTQTIYYVSYERYGNMISDRRSGRSNGAMAICDIINKSCGNSGDFSSYEKVQAELDRRISAELKARYDLRVEAYPFDVEE